MTMTAPTQLKVTAQDLILKKKTGRPITILTAYDYPTAQILDASGIDSILVGDSLAMAVLGYETTLPVTMEEMLHHAKAVSRGARRALLIGDLPFLSYQASSEDALRNAGRFLKEAGMDAVKLEGGREHIGAVRAIIKTGIPVMGHLGLTPQSVKQFGGWKVQGKTAPDAQRILLDAEALEKAGCFAIVLESIPERLASLISKKLRIPTIGIGAGKDCDGQVLVIHDLLGLFQQFSPKFVRRYAELAQEAGRAVAAFKKDVEEKKFPQKENVYEMPDEEWQILTRSLGGTDPSHKKDVEMLCP